VVSWNPGVIYDPLLVNNNVDITINPSAVKLTAELLHEALIASDAEN